MEAAAALHLADAEPATWGFLERHLPNDGFALVGAHGRPDLVLAGGVDAAERWVDRAPVIVLGREESDVLDRVHAFRRGCDDFVAPPFDYQELQVVLSSSSPISVFQHVQAVFKFRTPTEAHLP